MNTIIEENRKTKQDQDGHFLCIRLKIRIFPNEDKLE